MKIGAKQSKARGFTIECSFADNQHIRDMPNRRFNKRTKTWEAPALSRNVAFIRGLQSKGIAELSSGAENLCAEVESLAARVGHRPFPAWYPFKTQPYKVQRRGLDAMWSIPNPALFCEMGTGKSKMIIDWFSAKIIDGQAQSVVIFCPVSIRDNWREQIEIHCPLADVQSAVVHASTAKAKRELYEFMDGGGGPKVLICGIESLQAQIKMGKAYDAVLHFVTREHNKPFLAVVDESHLIQNADTNRWKNISSLSQSAAARVIATGTETDGNPLDLYGQFEFLNENILGFGNFYSFRNRYTIRGGYENREIISYQNLDELTDLIKPHIFQATKADVVDLPDKVRLSPRVVQLTEDQKKLIKGIRSTGLAQIKGQSVDAVVEGVLAVFTAIQQVCCGHIGHKEVVSTAKGEREQRTQTRVVEPANNPKIRELLSVLPEVRGKVLIWCKYRLELSGVVEVLSDKYGPGSVLQFHGDMDRGQRAQAIERFRSDPRARFFVLMATVGGTGLTLNEANYSIYMSNSFKLRDRLQSEDRNHRIGQGAPVKYLDIVADDPVERLILNALRDKKDVADFLRERIRDGQRPGELI